MQSRIRLLTATLAVAVLGISTSSASAATLYTTAAHTTPVPVGTVVTTATAVGAPGGPYPFNYTASFAPGAPFETCASATLNVTVTQNSGGVFKASPTGPSGSASLNGCLPAALAPQLGGSIVQVSGSSVASGSNTAWLNAGFSFWTMTWSSNSVPFKGILGAATGNPPTNGVFVQQPTTAKVPVSLVLSKAGPVNGNGVSGWLDATYTSTGASASYSFG
jgi:hypothetical protein